MYMGLSIPDAKVNLPNLTTFASARAFATFSFIVTDLFFIDFINISIFKNYIPVDYCVRWPAFQLPAIKRAPFALCKQFIIFYFFFYLQIDNCQISIKAFLYTAFVFYPEN